MTVFGRRDGRQLIEQGEIDMDGPDPMLGVGHWSLQFQRDGCALAPVEIEVLDIATVQTFVVDFELTPG